MVPLSETSPFTLASQTAVVTGGGTGIGFGIARCFVQAGARVVLVGRREETLRNAANNLGPAATYQCADITETRLLPDLVADITKRHGNVSILVNNAGNHLKKAALDTSPGDMRRVLEIHVVASCELTRLFGEQMAERGTGSILFIGSMAGFLGIPMVTAYSAAKSAVTGLVRALSSELSPRGVRVNAVAPGWIETQMLHSALNEDPERTRKILERTPMASFGCSYDVGWAAVYLCSPAARFVTGVVLPVDGGASIGF